MYFSFTYSSIFSSLTYSLYIQTYYSKTLVLLYKELSFSWLEKIKKNELGIRTHDIDYCKPKLVHFHACEIDTRLDTNYFVLVTEIFILEIMFLIRKK